MFARAGMNDGNSWWLTIGTVDGSQNLASHIIECVKTYQRGALTFLEALQDARIASFIAMDFERRRGFLNFFPLTFRSKKYCPSKLLW